MTGAVSTAESRTSHGLANSASLESSEYLAAIALQDANGNYNQALEIARLAVKLLSRWKLLAIIDTGDAKAAVSPTQRLTEVTDTNAP